MFSFQATHPETDQPLEVEALYFPAQRGLRDRYGAPQEPDDHETVLICGAKTRSGESVEVEPILDRLSGEAWNHVRQLKNEITSAPRASSHRFS